MRRVVLSLAALLVAALAFTGSGALAAWTGLDELDPLLRMGALALALAVAARAIG